MNEKPQKYIGYFRVSTTKQGIRGLGMESQKEIVDGFVESRRGVLINSYLEIAKGNNINRQQLTIALQECKKENAILVVAKLDRLARNTHFVTGLQEAKIKFVAVDFPEANEFVITIMAAVAQYEAKIIGERTRKALAIAKKRGTILGCPAFPAINENRIYSAFQFAESLRSTIIEMTAQGFSYSKIAKEFTENGIKTPGGLTTWSAHQVHRVVSKLRIPILSPSMERSLSRQREQPLS